MQFPAIINSFTTEQYHQTSWKFCLRTFLLHLYLRRTMTGNRPHTASGVGAGRFLAEPDEDENPRRISLDPRVMRAHGNADRPHTLVTGIDYCTVRKLKMKFDTGAKIVRGIKRAVELVTSTQVDDSQLSEIVDIILDSEVSSTGPICPRPRPPRR